MREWSSSTRSVVFSVHSHHHWRGRLVIVTYCEFSLSLSHTLNRCHYTCVSVCTRVCVYWKQCMCGTWFISNSFIAFFGSWGFKPIAILHPFSAFVTFSGGKTVAKYRIFRFWVSRDNQQQNTHILRHEMACVAKHYSKSGLEKFRFILKTREWKEPGNVKTVMIPWHCFVYCNYLTSGKC